MIPMAYVRILWHTYDSYATGAPKLAGNLARYLDSYLASAAARVWALSR